MDSFTCGLCHTTFHLLEDFVQHKQTHDSQNESRLPSKLENGVEAVAINTKLTGLPQLSFPCYSPAKSSSSCNSTSTCCASSNCTPSMKYQSHSCISNIKRVYASNAKSSAAVGSHEKALQLSKVHDTSFSMSSRTGRDGFKELSLKKGLSPPQVLDQIYKSSSRAVRYRIDSDGHLQKFSSEYKTDTNPAMSSSSGDISDNHLSLTNPKDLSNEEHLSITVKANGDCDTEIVMDEERGSSILIFESGNETVLMGQLILEDNSKDVVMIEITESNGEIEGLVQPTTGMMLTDMNVGVERRNKHSHIQVSLAESCLSYSALGNAYNNDSTEQAVALTGSMAKKNTKNDFNESSKNSENQNSLLINGCKTPHTPRFQSRKELQENMDNINEEETRVDGISHRQFRSIHETCKTEVNSNGPTDLREENANLGSSAELPASPENENANKTAKSTEESDASKGQDVGRWLNLDGDSSIIPQSAYDEGMELVTTSNGIPTNSEWNDTTYASTPGLYTLLLNADNTFTLVAGGYQGPSAGQSNRIFVCHLCKKFTQSQVEILNHISASHPEVLDDVNRCIGEFSLLPPSLVDNEDTPETSPVLMSVDVPLPTNGTNELLGNPQSYQEDSFARSEPIRKIKKKLGRPRKEDQMRAEAQNQEPNVKRGFFKEGDGITCVNCHKYFVKCRQYDKHRCSVWKESLHQFEECNKANLMPGKEDNFEGNDEREAGFGFSSIAEDDLEEEWKVNKRFKPKVKIKAGGDERRKRGRLPKVDVLASKAVVPDSSQNGKDELNNSHTTGHGNNNKDMTSQFVAEDIKSTISMSHATGSSPPCLGSIPTLPVFSNTHQQERLQKWIAQTDLSFVDSIIDKLNPGEGDVIHETEMYRCQKCQVMFRSLLACRRHCAKHMSRKAFTCPDCDFATANVGVLYNHYRIHTQNLYACSKCDFRARIKSHIRDHLETHYPSRYICRLCQKPYSTSNSLRSHIYLYHASNDGEKYLWSLRKKNQDRSSKNVFFQCPVCGKLFGERSSANRHLASHGPSIPKVQIKCEVCGTDLPSNDAFKKHMQKHKVVYVCCICNEPQVTANSLRNHQKGSSCQSLHPAESFKQSILLSFTSKNTFPSLLANKRIGPLLQDVKNSVRKDPTYVKDNKGLFKQMQEIGYKQIFQLLKEREQPCLQGDVANNKRDVMKILVDTGSAEEVKQFIPWDKQQDAEEQVDCQYNDLVHQTIQHNPELAMEGSRSHQKAAMFLEGCSNQGTISFDGNGSSATESPVYLRDRDPHTGESDQRVVVISNIGEEQTVVVEDGQVVLMEEEHFVIINDESIAKEPLNFAKFFGDAD